MIRVSLQSRLADLYGRCVAATQAMPAAAWAATDAARAAADNAARTPRLALRSALAVCARVLAVAAVIGVSTWMSIALTQWAGGATPLCLSSGLLVGILLTAAHARWAAYLCAALAGSLAAHFVHGEALAEAALHGGAGLLEAGIVACTVRHWVADVSDPEKLPLVSRVAPCSTVVACALSALIVAAFAQARGSGAFGATFAAWFAAHVLGIVVIATSFVVLRHRIPVLLDRRRPRRDFALTIALVAATTLLVFSQSRFPLLFLVYPPLVLAAFRHRFEGVAAGIVIVVIIALGANSLDDGPSFLIGGSSPLERVWFMQLFIATACLSVMPVVIVLAQRSRLQRALADGEQRLRAITDSLPALVAHVDLQQRYTFANAFLTASCDPHGGSIVGRTIREVRGAEAYVAIKPHIEAALRGRQVTFERELHANGRQYHYESTFVPDIAADGTVRGCYAMTFDVSERVRAQRELRRIAQHDSLTGLGNRGRFDDHFERAVGRYRRHNRSFTLVYLDVDRFKTINDTFGHAVGDAVLCELARRLESNLRDTDLPVRLGGDEFAVICEGGGCVDALDAIGGKLVAMMQPPMQIQGMRLQVSASIGIAVGACAADAQDLKLAADRALYEAKAAGRNTYRIAVAQRAAVEAQQRPALPAPAAA